MSKLVRYRFVVEGAGEFPFDMLRYDSCWPSRERDSLALTERGEIRRVTLEFRAEVHTLAPTRDRWHSFGWRVASVERVQ